MTIAEVVSLLAVGISLYAILSQRRYVMSQARMNESTANDSSVKTALTLRSEMKSDRDALRSEYRELEDRFEILQSSLDTAQKIITDSAQELQKVKAESAAQLVSVNRHLAQLDLMFNSLLKGAWILVAQVKRNGQEPEYIPPKAYDTGPLAKQYTEAEHE